MSIVRPIIVTPEIIFFDFIYFAFITSQNTFLFAYDILNYTIKQRELNIINFINCLFFLCEKLSVLIGGRFDIFYLAV